MTPQEFYRSRSKWTRREWKQFAGDLLFFATLIAVIVATIYAVLPRKH